MKTVAIVGSHPDTRSDAPWDNPAVDIWVFNEAANQSWVKRWDAVFQLHLPTVYRNPHNRTDPKHWEWLQKKHGKPIYMQKTDALVLDSEEYPLEQIYRRFLRGFTKWTPDGLDHLKYFTSTISFAFALALYQGYERVLVYGVEMASTTEYVYQRDCTAFWLGLLLGHGVKVELHSAVAIFDQPLYGFDGDLTYAPELFENRLIEKRALMAEIETRCDQAKIILEGTDVGDNAALQKAMKERFDALSKRGEMKGVIHTLEIYLEKCNAMINETGVAMLSRQEFEFNTAAAQGEMEKIKTNINRMDGVMDYLYRAFTASREMKALKGFFEVAMQQHLFGEQLGEQAGRVNENLYWLQRADAMYKAAGGQKSVDAFEAMQGKFVAELNVR